jgi:HTH-type transcriptional regulator/antitoxin HipB
VEQSFDVAGFMRRVRRLADLSQRDLADEMGLSRAAVGRLESAPGRVDLGTFESILRLGGLHLAVVDSAGRQIAPVPSDTLRDHANRRFPAHLDATPPDIGIPSERGVEPRKGKAPAFGWYRQRPMRDRRRDLGTTPLDHPTVTSQRERAAAKRARQRESALAAAAREIERYGECTCFDACFERACLADCPCQCEPDRYSGWTRPEGE